MKGTNNLKHICVSDCVVAFGRELSLKTKSGFKINRALCGIIGCCVLMCRPEEAGGLYQSLLNTPTLLSADTHTHTHRPLCWHKLHNPDTGS